MYNNPYYSNVYSQQANLDRINSQMNDLEKMKQQIQQSMQQPQQPANINQTFQLAPTSRDVIRYAGSIDEVQRDMVIGDTPYFSKDMSVVWIKNTKGDIKTYELTEIVPKDAKDLQIDFLQSQIEELRKEMKRNDADVTNAYAEQNATDTTTINNTDGEESKSNKSRSVSKVSASKKEQ